jgi:GNAT superfamily N-acetyltransferase
MAPNGVRLATLKDIPQMAKVFADGFIDNDVFGRFMHPKRHDYPDDWLQYWNRDLTTHLLNPAARCYVRVDDKGQVGGCMMMARIGQGSHALAVSESYSHQLQRQLHATRHYVESMIWPCKSADHDAIAAFEQNHEHTEHYFTGDHAECWMIELLCIHPDAQKKGYGFDLVRTAIELCKEENPAVPLCVIASDVGDAFYEKYGFREVGRANVGALEGVKGGSLKFYEEHLKGNDR